MAELVAAVDVGTGSARAGLFDRAGALLGRAVHPIDTRRLAPGHAEHDSEAVWAAVAAALRAARAEAGVRPDAVAGLAFDATCSLVLRDAAGRPVGTSACGPDRWDTIVWHDHRAETEAAACTATGHAVIARHGGAMSPEMQIPKLLWLKRHLPGAWARLGHAFDLSDFLAWRATGRPVRSRCTLTCKWEWGGGGAPGWPQDFLDAAGLADLVPRCGLPPAPSPIGAPIGRLTAAAAAELGLAATAIVATGMVDAHAGALGVLGAFAAAPRQAERQIALIAGTSTCVMGFARAPRPVRGLWGPHADVALPGLWMVEGGQSASGGLLDHLCRLWGEDPAEPALHARILARIADMIAAEGPDIAPRLHVLPDFHGNRSPDADPGALGAISGLTLDRTFDGLCRLYWRAAVGIALGLRCILDSMAEQGFAAETLHATGGHARSPLLLGLYADATGRSVSLPRAPDATLLGTAMLAATGAGLHPDLVTAAAAMHRGAEVRAPDPAARARFERDYAAFRALRRHRRELDALTAGSAPGGTTR